MFSVTLVGNRELIARFGGVPQALLDELKSRTDFLGYDLQGYVVSQKLSGQVLNQRSGALARSIQYQLLSSGPIVQGRVYSAGDVKYAARWEFGFSGEITVPAHVRHGHTVFGREVAPFTAEVGSYSYSVNQAARSYLRTSMSEKRAFIEQNYLDAGRIGIRKALGK